jgi:uncharacterized membrane protein YhaH (DUF805 family)
MNFATSVRTCMGPKYAQFGGRASRSEFWWFDSLVSALYVLSFLILPGTAMVITVVLVLICTLIPHLAASVRRLHDTGRSGLWVLIGLVPYVGGLILLGMLVFRGVPGENEYGADPLSEGIQGGTNPVIAK